MFFPNKIIKLNNPNAFTPTGYIAEQIIYGKEGKIKLLLRVL